MDRPVECAGIEWLPDRVVQRWSSRRFMTCYRTASFSALPAENRTTRRFGILIGAPVCGLRAVRALRCAVLNVPKPTKVIGSPFLSDLVIPAISDSTAAAAPAFDEP